jgi:[ribosomal protein S18]-alanine N-acetyltransferase
MTPTLRLATPADMHAIWQIESQVFGDAVYPDFFFRQAMDLWPELLLVAEREGQLLGYGLGGVGQHRTQGWLLSLAVNPARRLYERLGYRELALEPAYFGPGEDRCLLEHQLVPSPSP